MTPRPGARDRRGAVAGVVLAAGLGSRFGGEKLAASLDGRPLVAHVLGIARSALDAGELGSVVVVAGAGPGAGRDAATVRALAATHGFALIDNQTPAAGLSRSVGLALTACEATAAEGALILLGDQPRVRLEVIRAVAERWRSGQAGFVIPRYRVGGSGNPVLLDRSVWPLATALVGDSGMVAVARERPDLVVYVDVDGGNPDVDTPEELAALDAPHT